MELGQVGSYELLLELAAGGMGSVLVARSAAGGLVAIKRPHRHLPDDAHLSMLFDEARLASSIAHPNVVRVRELGFEQGRPFLVMDYVEGGSLSDVQKQLRQKRTALPAPAATRILLDALAGLEAAHVSTDDEGRHLGIVHRDVSPHNIIVSSDGSGKLTDFGIARAVFRAEVTGDTEVRGKLAYAAPERVDGRRLCTAQSDVYSMAVCLWEAIAGRALYEGASDVEIYREIVDGTPPTLATVGVTVPSALETVIARGLARDLDERWGSAAEFARAIELAAGPGGVAARGEVAQLVEQAVGERLAEVRERIADAMRERDAEAIPLLRTQPPPMRAQDRLGAAPKESGTARKPSTNVGFVAAGIVLAVVVALAAWQRGRTPTLTAAASASAPHRGIRRVVVPLPMDVQEVTLDGIKRHLDTPANVAVFDLPRESGPRHFVTATAADGTRAEGFAREEDGLARVEDPGFKLTIPTLPDGTPGQVLHVRPSTAAGSAAARALTDAGVPGAATADAGVATPAPASAAATAPSSAPSGSAQEPARVEPPAAPAGATAQPEPGRSSRDIAALVLGERPRARACYERALADHPTLAGDVDIKWIIDPQGHVSTIGLDPARSTLTEPGVVTCIQNVIRTIQFAPSPRGVETHVHYPFNFKPSGKP